MRTRTLAAALGAPTLAAILTCAAAARADAAADTKVAAEALFESGRKLMTEGKYAEACPKFADSQRLDPSSSTLLNLGSCWEKAGHTATAWATYREAASAASATGRKDHLAAALRHADAIAPKLAHITVVIGAPVEGLQVRRDGVLVDRAEWGVAIPVDTGTHALEATAPGHAPWATSVDVASDGTETTVTIPALEASPAAAAPAAAQAASPGAAPANTAPPPPPASDAPGPSAGNVQRIVGLSALGLGAVGLGVGAILAIHAKSIYSDSLNHCDATDHDLCDAQGISRRDDARAAGNAATLAVSLGAAAAVAGAVLWITAPHAAPEESSHASWMIAPALGGAVVKGSF
jgi:hypothetical protein